MKKIQKQKSKPKVNSRPKRKQFLAHHLGIILVVFLLLEGLLVTQTQAQDWSAGVSILDMSATVEESAANLSEAFAPQIMLYEQVTEFYSEMADEMEDLLVMNDAFEDVSYIWLGVTDFYQQSADELGTLLGLQQVSVQQSMVSGAAISN